MIRRPAHPWRRGADGTQGWTQKEVDAWYGCLYQGSRLIPEAWLYALEQPGGDGRLFLDKAYIEGFRYLTGPGRLPVGFAVERQNDSAFVGTRLRWKAWPGASEPWIGMTCAACHTNDIRVGARTMRIDGGSTLADFQAFIEAFDTALTRTRDTPARFDRFAGRVLGPDASGPDKQRLRDALSRLVELRQKASALDRTSIRYGPARLDAVGYIYNKVEGAANPDAPAASPPDAPVSYPFLWNVSQQTRIQWDGVGRNTPMGHGQVFDAGALGRNLAEVTGVFGEIDIPANPKAAFITSIHVDNLVAIEQQLMRLKAPLWPRDQFPIDNALAALGNGLYGAKCASCHRELSRDDLTTRHGPDGGALETMSYLEPREGTEARADTDPWMACNAVMDKATDRPRLNGRKTHYPGGPTVFGPTAPNTVMLQAVVVDEMLSKKGAVSLAALESFTNTHAGPKVFKPTPPAYALPPMLGASPGEDFARAERPSKCLEAGAGPAYQGLRLQGPAAERRLGDRPFPAQRLGSHPV